MMTKQRGVPLGKNWRMPQRVSIQRQMEGLQKLTERVIIYKLIPRQLGKSSTKVPFKIDINEVALPPSRDTELYLPSGGNPTNLLNNGNGSLYHMLSLHLLIRTYLY